MRMTVVLGTYAPLLAMLLIAWVGAIPAYAVTVTFEDGGFASGTPIPDGYSGLNWTGFRANNNEGLRPNGYVNGRVSGTFVASNEWQNPASVETAVPIVLHSAYLTGAWNDGLSVRAEGYLGDTLCYTRIVTVSAYQPTLVNYEFANVDKVVWSSWGGIPVYSHVSQTHFAIDNLSYDFVPEHSSLATLLSGVLGVSMWRKREIGSH